MLPPDMRATYLAAVCRALAERLRDHPGSADATRSALARELGHQSEALLSEVLVAGAPARSNVETSGGNVLPFRRS